VLIVAIARDQQHLSYFISNLLSHIQQNITTFVSRPDRNNFVLYSCHDINLFAFLMAIGDPNTVKGPKAYDLTLENLYELWPGYGMYYE